MERIFTKKAGYFWIVGWINSLSDFEVTEATDRGRKGLTRIETR